MSPLNDAGLFLVKTIFDLYTMLIMIRFILQGVRADFYNPISQFVVKLTNPVVIPLRRFVPSIRGYDTSSLVWVFILTCIKLVLMCLLSTRTFPAIHGLMIWALGDILKMIIDIFFFAILIQVILSWVAPMSHSPIISLVLKITSPVMGPARRLIPTIGGFDISPIPVIIGLQLLIILVASPVARTGALLAIQ